MTHRKRPYCISSSADIIAGNDDLLIEILLFLPAKSLLRFKLVSKHWLSLISAPSFSRLHTLHHPRRRPQPQLSFILGGVRSIYFICNPTTKTLTPTPLLLGFPYVRILQSCNGLFLLECRKHSSCRLRYFYIFNPTTMQSRKLFRCKDSIAVGVSLIFNPSTSPHYKVVCFRNSAHDNYSRIFVFDSEKSRLKRWRKSHRETSRFPCGINWNNGLYFIRPNLPCFCFFLEKRLTCSIGLPATARIPGAAMKKYAMESNGHLHYLVMRLKKGDNCLYVYEMTKESSVWFLKYEADFNPVSGEFGGNNGVNIRLLGMIRAEREEDSMLLFHVPGKIMIYRFFDRVFEVLVDFRDKGYFEEGRLQFGFSKAHPFVESFAPV